ncbi:MAG: 50S ribosomal protein L11 methyltransferase, partial [Bacteroidota bacterium]
LHIEIDAPYREIMIAELADVGYDAFTDVNQGLQAYIHEQDFDKEVIENLAKQYKDHFTFRYQTHLIHKQNWNENWEKQYQPIIVDNACRIRASFHKADKSYRFEIIIDPKMSFGTGHHETTYLMITNQLNIDHKGKSVLDVGCGTGILTIMASKLGATKLTAIDLDDWAIENTKQNIGLNHLTDVHVHKGTIQAVKLDIPYDIILANINKNVLLDELPIYSEHLSNRGYLLVSGFYEEDTSSIISTTKAYHFVKINQVTKNHWTSIVFQKN